MRRFLELPPRLDELPPAPWRFKGALFAIAAVGFAYYAFVTWTQWRAGAVLGDPMITFNRILSVNAAGGPWFDHPRRPGNHFFTNHVMLWMLPASLLYELHDSLFTFTTLVNGALAAAAVPLALYVRRMSGSAPLALAGAALWLANTSTASMKLALGSEALAMPFWFVLFWAVECRRYRVAIAASVGLLCVKEDMAVWLAFYVLWAWGTGRLPRGQAIGGFALCIAAFVFFRWLMVALPHAGAAEVGDFWVAERYGGRAQTLGGLALYFASHPLELLRSLATPLWLALLAAGGGIALLGWRSLPLLLPPACLFFTADMDAFRLLLYYYAYPFLPPLFLAYAEGVRWIADRTSHRLQSRVAAALAVVAIVVLPQLPSRTEGHRLIPFRTNPHAEAARVFIERNVPADGTGRVMAQWTMHSFVPRGHQLWILDPERMDEVSLVLTDRAIPAFDLPPEQQRAVREALENPQGPWRRKDALDSFEAWERRHR